MTEKEKKERGREMEIDWPALEEYWTNRYEEDYVHKK